MIKFIMGLMIFQFGIAMIYGLRERKKNGTMPLEKMAITGFIPAFGLLIPYAGKLFKGKDSESLSDVFDHSGQELSNDIRYEKRIEFDKETNYVPVEEALIMNDSVVKRKLIMDTAKEDAYDFISFLKVAMADRDMETSHYAASIVMEINRNLQNVIQEASVSYEQNKHDVKNLENYVEIVAKYYQSGLLDEINERRYGYLYSKLLGELLEHRRFSEQWYTEKIETDLRLKNYSDIFPYLEKYEKRYPESEKPYLLKMKYYFQIGNKEGIDEVIRLMEDTHVNLTREGLEIMKYWSEKEA